MTIHILLWLFGETIIAAGCNLPAWLRLSVAGVRDPFIPVSALLVRLALVATSAGLMFGSYLRFGMAIQRPDILLQPIPIVIPWTLHYSTTELTFHTFNSQPWITIIWIALIFTGELGMLAGSYYALKGAGMKRPHTWMFVILSTAWTLLVFAGGLS